MFLLWFVGLGNERLHRDVCEFAKHKRVNFPMSNKRCATPFYLIHSDVWGPSITPNISGPRWFVSFIDDCTQISWIFLLKDKSDVRTVFQNSHSMIQNQFGEKIKKFRSDNAREYSITPCLPILKRRELSMNHLAPIPHNKRSGREKKWSFTNYSPSSSFP